jgi:hypothetical protein
MIRNKIQGRFSSDPVCALVAFAHYKRDIGVSRRDLKNNSEEFVELPGIPLDEEYSVYSP